MSSSKDQRDKVRLHRQDMNNLIAAISLDNETKVPPLVIEASNKSLEVTMPVRVTAKGKVLLGATKDSKRKENLPELPYIGDVIAKVAERADLKDKVLLIPMYQCRRFGKLSVKFNLFKGAQREHIVLVEADLKNGQIQVHDSQSKLRYAFYPDRLKDIASALNCSYVYHAYGDQKDDVMCGYYVHEYILQCLQNKSCDEVSLKAPEKAGDIKVYKKDYLATHGVKTSKKDVTEEKCDFPDEGSLLSSPKPGSKKGFNPSS